MARHSLLLLSLFLSFGCTAKIVQMTARQRSERLARERGRLSELTDPVALTKSYITISTILLTFTSEAVREGDTGVVRTLIDQYIAAVQRARDTMVMSNRDAERRPGGYKELEIALRGQLRFLEDINKQLVLEERKPLADAIATAVSVRDEMLRLMFPQAQMRASRTMKKNVAVFGPAVAQFR
jgi:hypothetical protein